jgi:aminomethyltransferase
MSDPFNATPKQTTLHATHVAAGARIVEFGGWSMPVQYSSILEEHHAVRKQAGLFDISHMGEFVVDGDGAAAWLNRLLTNDIDKLAVGQGQYTLMLNEEGGVIDDLLIYRTEATQFFLVVNASKIDEDAAWMQRYLPAEGVVFDNQSEAYAGLALQGPQASAIWACLTSEEPPRRNRMDLIELDNHIILAARTGYTGEDGFEFFCAATEATEVWANIMLAGEELGLKPCGLGARDSLRLEACLPLNGNDLDPVHTPFESGLGNFVSLKKAANFPGKAKLQEQRIAGVPTKLVALRMVNKGAPPRSHYPVYVGAEKVGEVTSGTLSPTLGWGIGLAYVQSKFVGEGKKIDLEVRGQRLPAEIVAKPFYKKA